MTDVARIPYCHKIRYGITGAPILTEDEMDGSHAPGVGVSPTLIELVYSAARDDKPASVSASVTGSWMRFGERADGQVATHFKGGPDGWPEWLAEEARLHDPERTPVVPPADRAAARDRIADAIRDAACTGDCGQSEEECAKERIQPFVWHHGRLAVVEGAPEMFADVVLGVWPEPADRAAVLREAAGMLDQRASGIDAFASSDYGTEAQTVRELAEAANELRRVADEAQPEERLRCPHCQMPHDLTPGSVPVAVCESVRQRIANAGRLHAEGDHSLCTRSDCEVLRERAAAEAQPTTKPEPMDPVHILGLYADDEPAVVSEPGREA